jgi:hypothetical protein
MPTCTWWDAYASSCTEVYIKKKRGTETYCNRGTAKHPSHKQDLNHAILRGVDNCFLRELKFWRFSIPRTKAYASSNMYIFLFFYIMCFLLS